MSFIVIHLFINKIIITWLNAIKQTTCCHGLDLVDKLHLCTCLLLVYLTMLLVAQWGDC